MQKFEIIKSCRTQSSRLGKIPNSGGVFFNIFTPTIVVSASATIRNKTITSLMLFLGEDRVQIICRNEMDYKITQDNSKRWSKTAANLQAIESWFKTENGLDAIIDSQLFVQELEILVNVLESGKKTKSLGI